jgi:antitoxin ParD1/3/4
MISTFGFKGTEEVIKDPPFFVVCFSLIFILLLVVRKVGFMETIMQSKKLSISLPKQQCEFIEHYLANHQIKNRSEVIKEALYLLQQKELETCYREANQEINRAFENTNLDGIEDNEAW